MISDGDVLQHCSSGLALKGLVVDNYGCQVHDNVITLPSDITFSEPNLQKREEQFEFYTKSQKNKFLNRIEKFGNSILRPGGIGYSSSLSDESEINEDENDRDDFYFGIVKCWFQPTASYTIKIDTVNLSSKCIDELVALERRIQVLSGDDKQELCEIFFNKFGTHINKGPIIFGGIYLWKIDCYVDKESKERIQDIVRKAMDKFVGIGTNEDLKTEIVEKHKEVKNLSIEVECLSIPFKTMEFDLWKIYLAENNKDWHLIDLGEKLNLIGIWDMLENHRNQFVNIPSFRNNLINAYKSYLQSKQQSTTLLKSIRKYCNDPHFYMNCKEYLINVIISKFDVKKETKSLRIWWTILETAEMGMLMVSVLRSIESFDTTDTFYIKAYLTELLCKSSDRMIFQGKNDLMRWLDISPSLNMTEETITSFIFNVFTADIRLNILPNLKFIKLHKKEANSRTRVALSRITKHVIMALESSKNHSSASFVKLMLLDLKYDIVHGVFIHSLTVEMIETFLQRFGKESININNYIMQQNENVSFYLLQLVLDVAEREKDSISREEVFKALIKYVHLSEEADMYAESYINKVNTWEKLKSVVHDYIYGQNIDERIEEEEEEDSLLSVFSYTSEKEQYAVETEIDEANIIDQSKWKVITELGLSTLYPGKITIEHVRKLSTNKVGNIEDIPWCFLDSVLSLDYKLWSNFENRSGGITSSKLESNGMPNFTKLRESRITSVDEERYNPMDIVVAVFLCCNNFLKQLLVQKLYICHLSVPFLLPDITEKCIIQLCTIRGIGLLSDCIEDPAVNQSYPIVSFIRASNLAQSKTKLLNKLLCDRSHETFFNKDMEGEIRERQLSDGLISAAWYHPPPACSCVTSNASQCHFNKFLMFLNLRGNCEKFEIQKNVICMVSTVVVIMVDISKLDDAVIENINSIIDASKQVFIIFTKEDNFPITDCEEAYNNLKNALGDNEKKVKNVIFTFTDEGKLTQSRKLHQDIKTIINVLTSQNEKDIKSLEDHFQNSKIPNVKFDYDNSSWKLGKEKALEIFEIMKNYEISFMKDNVLPLQGNLWHRWGKIEREAKTGSPGEMESQDHFIARLYRQQKTLREDQHNQFKRKSNEIMKIVISMMINLKDDSRNYFIQWVTYFLKEISRDKLNDLYNNLSEKRSHLNSIKEMMLASNEDDVLTLRSEIKLLLKGIENVTINLSHLLREIGQIYEALKSSSKISLKLKDLIENIPRMMAELFLTGSILEIVDGNAKQVPISFMKSICCYLKDMIKGNVFVLSVIGIQSSGKSTLLNVMFGTQFLTNAGLCTQGVNAQLIPLPSNISTNGYEYIMLLDTEGLRAYCNEIKDTSQSYDNELATLVIGISDLTIINMKGETQTEMNDILQIVAHALLKIKSVNNGLQLRSKCFFIHHNVEAIDASEKLKDENQKLLDNLDDIVSTASRNLGIKGINCFSQLIEFNIETDIKYFPNLWHGVPPMAPVNTEYTRKAKEMKTLIVEEIIYKRRYQYQLDIYAFLIRLEDVWKGILRENFVFDFKNCLEINAFATLERTFNELKCELNEVRITWLREKRKHIHDLSLQSIEMYRKQIEEEVNKKYEAVEIKLTNFFKNNNEGLLLKHRSNRYQYLLNDLKDDIIKNIIKTLSEEIDMQARQEELDSQLDDWKKQARYKAIELAESKRLTKEMPSDEELEIGFVTLWLEVLSAIPHVDLEEENVDITIENVLRNAAQMDVSLYQEQSRLQEDPQETFEIKDHHITKHYTDSDCIHKANGITFNIMEKIKVFLNEIKNENFSKSHVERLVQIVTTEIDGWNEKKDFKLTKLYKISILVFVGRYTKPFFKQMQEKFRNKLNPASHLETQFKDELRIRYFNTFNEIAPEQTAATIFSQVIQYLIKIEVDNDLFKYLIYDIKQNHEFIYSKKDFISKVLTDLVKEDSFEEYMEYVGNTEEYLYVRLNKYINKYLFGTEAYLKLASSKFQLILQLILQHFERVERHITQPDSYIGMTGWMELFIQEMIFIFPRIREETKDLMDYSKEDTFDVNTFHLFLTNSLLNGLSTKYNHITQFESIDGLVIEQLTTAIRGCNKKCPFCKTPCLSTINGHGDACASSQHYPLGVCGGKHADTQMLSIQTCNTLVDSENRFRNKDTRSIKVPFYTKIVNFILYGDSMFEYDIVSFSDYQTVYKKWNIHGDRSLGVSLYWKWFIAKYKQQLADKYNAELPDIPQAWAEITEDEAIRSLGQL